MQKLSKWLPFPPKDSPEQQHQDLSNLLRDKEKALETTAYDLKVKVAAMYVLEQKVMASESMLSSTQKELAARDEQVKTLKSELSARLNRVKELEAEESSARQHADELNAIMATQASELHEAQQARLAAEQAQDVFKEEVRVLREHIAQLNDGLADRELLRANMQNVESMQDRINHLEKELTDRETARLNTVQKLEHSLAERDRQMKKIETVNQLLQTKESEISEWERKSMRLTQEHEGEISKLQEQCASEISEWERKSMRLAQEHEGEVRKLQEQCAAQEQLREQHRSDEQRLHERDELISSLHHQLHDMQATRQNLLQEVQQIREKDEQIDRLQKRLKEMRETLKEKSTPAQGSSHPARPNGAGKKSQERQSTTGKSKSTTSKKTDDLNKIKGIGPVIAQTLNQMGTHTFVQIARWKSEDIKKIAKKLNTDPERIKRDKWIAEAKEQHFQKYGERL